ncbi:MAG TPA: putative zinc-binding metallopeptidase [Ilumatobacter sp.]|nr:putative zinc-binding metallopeptidase [Ilumatobacter sp.]
MDLYYATADGSWDSTRFVSPYAAAHPLEDWAETFAHYLHIVDATDTAIAYDLVASGTAPARNGRHATGATFERLLDAWRPINAGVNAIAEALGAAPLYPFDPTGVVVDKLAFVHQQVTAHTQRDAFYAYV